MRPSTLQKQTNLLQAATALLIEQGYTNTTLDQIVLSCGGSKQTLYRYFGNKEGLFKAVLAYHLESLDELFEFAHASSLPLRAGLVEFGEQYIQRLCSNPLLGLFRIVAADFHHHPEIPVFFLNHGPIAKHHQLADYLNQMSNEACVFEDTELAAQDLLSLMRERYFYRALLGCPLPDKAQVHQHIERVVEHFLHSHRHQTVGDASGVAAC
ncbi:TetR/AcrR family transcriptional regulator [Vibrio fluvialis]|nr:TetR/AcrR family transcriptional regulator [Vibrio fluvialis]MBY7896185.1 TetR/AcrR family transcriptional regulator [Vibrio fluvialis]